jgi:hypothetical protein
MAAAAAACFRGAGWHYPVLAADPRKHGTQGFPGHSLRQKRLAFQALAGEPLEQVRLVLLVAAGDQDQVLGRERVHLRGFGFGQGGQAGVGGGLPEGLDLGGDGRGQLQEALVELLLGLGQGGQKSIGF